MAYILALDQGTTSSRAIVFDHDGSIQSVAQKEFTQIFPQRRLGRARRRGDLGVADRRRRRSARPRRARRPATSRRSASPISAKPPSSGIARPASRFITRSSGRIAGPRSSASDSKARRRRPDRAGRRPDCSSTRIFRRARSAGSSTTSPGARAAPTPGTARVRHDRHVADLEADRRAPARHRRQQRVAHDAVQHPHARVGRRAAAAVRRAGEPAAGGPHVRARSYGDTVDVARPRDRSRLPASPAISRRRSSARCAAQPGMSKNTYGTGCFLLQNIGTTPTPSRNQLVTTVAWQIGGRTEYALEGSVFIGGAVVQWIRDGLGLIRTAAEIEPLALTRARQRRRLSWCRRLPDSARRTGIRSRAARSSASRAARPPAHSRARRSKASRSRSPICSMRWPPTAASPRPSCASTAARPPTTR